MGSAFEKALLYQRVVSDEEQCFSQVLMDSALHHRLYFAIIHDSLITLLGVDEIPAFSLANVFVPPLPNETEVARRCAL